MIVWIQPDNIGVQQYMRKNGNKFFCTNHKKWLLKIKFNSIIFKITVFKLYPQLNKYKKVHFFYWFFISSLYTFSIVPLKILQWSPLTIFPRKKFSCLRKKILSLITENAKKTNNPRSMVFFSLGLLNKKSYNHTLFEHRNYSLQVIICIKSIWIMYLFM